MEASGVAVVFLLCVWFSAPKTISGANDELRARPGDDVTLYCDCVQKSGFKAVWFRNCSHQNQPRLMIWLKSDIPRYSLTYNNSSGSFDLMIQNVGQSDLGLYYCGLHDRAASNSAHEYGNRWTRLSLLEENSTFVTVSPNTPAPHVLGVCVSWPVLITVSAVCVLASTFVLFASMGVYFKSRHTPKAKVRAEERSHGRTQGMNEQVEVEEELCYSSVDFRNIAGKKKQRIQHSDFSTYSEVRREN